ncbi:hypothetical protein C8J56DRAFT_1054532 [Mycena floridula]|nr:hypothetical protein C8J56DRAFT_1054532 [Mycena floridula]
MPLLLLDESTVTDCSGSAGDIFLYLFLGNIKLGGNGIDVWWLLRDFPIAAYHWHSETMNHNQQQSAVPALFEHLRTFEQLPFNLVDPIWMLSLPLLANSASVCHEHAASTVISCLLRTRWTPDLRRLLAHLGPVSVAPAVHVSADGHEDPLADDDNLPELISVSDDGLEYID